MATVKKKAAVKKPTVKKFKDGGIKDKWGRSEKSKWYGFNPDTKKYEKAKPKTTGGLTPNSERLENKSKNGVIAYTKTETNSKGKRDLITSDSKKTGNVTMKKYDAKTVPTYTVRTRAAGTMNDKNAVKNYEKSMDTTGYSKGRQTFIEKTEQKLPGGNMSKTTTRVVGRGNVKPILDKMKKAAETPKKYKTGGVKTKATPAKKVTVKRTVKKK